MTAASSFPASRLAQVLLMKTIREPRVGTNAYIIALALSSRRNGSSNPVCTC